MGLNVITFGGISSSDYNVYAAGPGMYTKPRRKITLIEVPGRSGALAMDEGTFENYDLKFQCVLPQTFQENFDNFCAAINALGGYQILEESCHPNDFRMATFQSEIQPTPTRTYKGAKFELVFNCKPHRFLLSGLTSETFTAAGTITNPTGYESQPNIRVYGFGTVGVGSDTITIPAHSYPYIDIDCEAMDARYQSTNCNNLVSVTNFPVLHSGNTGISLGGNVVRVDIQPRWRTI